jgi:hypothetical protein
MPNDTELRKMKAIGARVEQLQEGWQTTIVREERNGTVHEETWPLRITLELAEEDVRREMPDAVRASVLTEVQQQEAAE